LIACSSSLTNILTDARKMKRTGETAAVTRPCARIDRAE
jgi:hypothetical protein